MVKKWILMLWVTTLLLCGVYSLQSYLQQKNLADKLIRLHVVANSDSEADQKLKLIIRDAVLGRVEAITQACDNVNAASKILQARLDEIERTAKQTAEQNGSLDTIQVSLEEESFPTRFYDTFTLPAGRYLSLRVKIGAAQGHNWWCVVFPSLCTAATTEDWQRAAEVGSFTASETNWLTEGKQHYTLKFKTWEWLQKII